MRTLAPQLPVRPLTDREVDVLQRLTRGDSSRRIAAGLGLSRSTVRDAYENAQRKLRIDRESAYLGVPAPYRRGL
jgi:DNA-binding CsgD family transcriptional regulator